MRKFLLALLALLFAAAVAIGIAQQSAKEKPLGEHTKLFQPVPVSQQGSSQQTPPNESSQNLPNMGSARNNSELDMAVTNNVSMLLVDSSGQSTGRDAQSQVQLEEIPGSSYFEDSVSGEISRSIEIVRPQEGMYDLILTSIQTGHYQLSIRAFAQDGRAEPEILKAGDLIQGQQAKLKLVFKSTSGQISTIEQD